MLRRTPIFSALLPQVLGSGLQPDLHQLQRLLWDEAQNVSFQGGRIKRRPPNQLAYSAGTEPIRGITQHLDADGVRWLWAASGGDVSRWYGPPKETVLAGAAWTEDQGLLYNATFWDMLPFGEWVLLNSSQGKLRVWKPTDGVTNLADGPSDVVALRKKYNFLVAFGYGGAKTRIGWSKSDDIQTWTAAADNNAGSLTVAEFNTPIRAVAPMGEADAVFAEDQMVLFSYKGTPFWFGYKFALDGIGAIGKASVTSDGRNCLGVGRNGVWWTDGNSSRYIDEGYLHDYLQDRVNWDQGSKIVAARNDVTGCFDFSFPMDDSLVPNEAWSFDPRNGSWYPVPPFSYKDERRLFRKPIMGRLDGGMELELEATEGLPLELRTKPLLAQLQDETGLRDVHNNVSVDEVDILLHAATAVEWRLGAGQESNGSFSWTPWIEAQAGARTYKVPKLASGGSFPSGVFHKLEFRSVADVWALDLQGFELFGRLVGTKRS